MEAEMLEQLVAMEQTFREGVAWIILFMIGLTILNIFIQSKLGK